MVPVDDENRQLHREVLIHIVRILVLVGQKLDILLSENVLIHHLLELETK